MKKLLLINPSFGRKIKGQIPLNLAYLAAAVESYAPVKIIDLNVKSLEELNRAMKDFQPTHVGITSYTPNNIDAKKILKGIHDEYPDVVTICGGPHEIYRGEVTEKLYPWINHVVRDSKGENALVKIITGEDKQIDWKKIFPAYHLLDMQEESYHFDSNLFSGKRMLTYMSARGCNMHCLFCPSEDYIPLDNKTVIDHIRKIVEMGYEAIFFNDVNFASSPKRTRELMELMIDCGLNSKIEWGCQTAAVSELSDDILQLMKKAGCTYITYSLESVSKEALEKIRKRINPETVTSKAIVSKKLGMKVGLYVMFGIHSDEKKDFYWAQRTLDKVGEIEADFVSYSVLADYPSSNPLLDYERVKFGEENVWKFFDEGQAHHPNCSVEYAEQLKEEIKRRHRDWPNIKIF